MFRLVTPEGTWTRDDLVAAQPRYLRLGPSALVPPDPASVTQALVQPPDAHAVLLGALPEEVADPLPADLVGWLCRSSGSTGPAAWVPIPQGVVDSARFRSERSPCRWGLLYDPSRMSGLLVLASALRSESTVVAPARDWGTAARMTYLANHGVTHLSATPTQWRSMLAAGTPLALEQVTVSGEVVDQALLDSLARRWPTARVSTVYATTETGPLLVSHDGLEGYSLESARGIVRLDSQGRVQARVGSRWTETGDLGETRDGRLVIVGRHDDRVSVAGILVDLDGLSRLLREVPGTCDVKVVSRPSPLAGHVLAAHVVPSGNCDLAALTTALTARTRAVLGIPALATVSFCENLANDTGKAGR